MTKSSLAIELSKLKLPERFSVKLEQYPTDSEVAADVLWKAHMLGDIDGKVIADLGCGNGILGIGAALLGAKKVYFVDTDAHVLDVAKENYAKIGIAQGTFIAADIDAFVEKVDLVIQNPPFGTREAHIDKRFLEKAFTLAPVVISFHKESTAAFVKAVAADHDFSITHHWRFAFPLKQTQEFHKRRIHRIDVGCWRMEHTDSVQNKTNLYTGKTHNSESSAN